jgi:hypothetical protein
MKYASERLEGSLFQLNKTLPYILSRSVIKTKQNKSKQNKTNQIKSNQNKTKQNRTTQTNQD